MLPISRHNQATLVPSSSLHVDRGRECKVESCVCVCVGGGVVSLLTNPWTCFFAHAPVITTRERTWADSSPDLVVQASKAFSLCLRSMTYNSVEGQDMVNLSCSP